MHYYKRNLGDYAKKAGHLTPLEHGVYNLIIDSYYDREQAPTLLEAMRWARARTEDEKSAVLAVLNEFFTLEDDRYRQTRCDAEIKKWLERGWHPHDPNNPPNRPPIDEWKAIRERIFARDDYICAYCNQRGGQLECDHIHPVSLGGGHTDENLATSCKKCNRDKGSKTLDQWAAADMGVGQ